MNNIKHIANLELEYYNGNWILWKSHNKDYTQGSYYIFHSNKPEIDLVIETAFDVQVIHNVSEVNE